MDKKELYNLLEKREKQVERNKNKRAIFVILIYAAVQFWIIHAQGQLNSSTIWTIIGEFLVCVFLGGIAWFFNGLIWSQVCRISQDENEGLEYLRKLLKEKEKEERNQQ